MLAYLLPGLLALLVAGYFIAPTPYVNAALRVQRRMAGLKTKSVRIGRHRVVYLEGGRGDPLLLLHGFGATSDNWLLLAKELTPHFRVIALDLPGYGASDRYPSAVYSLGAQLKRIDRFVRALGLTRFHLGGNSMGGYLAAHYAREHPAEVQSLWLLAPAGVVSAEPSEVLMALERGENLLLVNSESDFARVIELCFVDPPYMPKGFLQVFAARSMADAEFHARLFDELFRDPHPFEDSLTTLTTPTLITWGERDRILHASGAPILQALLPTSELQLLPDTGHVPMVEKPRECAAAFLKFQRVG